MEIKKSSRERLLEASAYLFRVNGYHNTSIADIATACNLRKASIYHHITSKKELGIAVLEQVTQFFSENLFSLAYDTSKTETERLATFATAIEKFFTDQLGGCIVGNFALEVLNTTPEFEPFIKMFFDEWAHAISTLLAKKYGEKQALELARDNAAFAQGCIMMSRLYKSAEPLARLRDQTISLLDSTIANSKQDAASYA